MDRNDCWEVMKCERQPGGVNTEAFGVCPATLTGEYDGVNEGNHGGRFCWAIAGTLCRGEVRGTYSMKIRDCLHCEFLEQVQEDEGRQFILTPQKAISIRESKEASMTSRAIGALGLVFRASEQSRCPSSVALFIPEGEETPFQDLDLIGEMLQQELRLDVHLEASARSRSRVSTRF